MQFFRLSVLSPFPSTGNFAVLCWAALMVGAFDDAEIVHVEGIPASGLRG